MATQYVDGVAVEIEGEGPPVVCIHGLGGTSNTWTPVLRALRGFKVIRIEIGAVGEKPAPADCIYCISRSTRWRCVRCSVRY